MNNLLNNNVFMKNASIVMAFLAIALAVYNASQTKPVMVAIDALAVFFFALSAGLRMYRI